MTLYFPHPLKALLLAAAFVAQPALAVPVSPVSYDMINGGGQASGGTFNYWDAGYGGSGAKTTDGAALTGGLGKLTDGVIATQNWSTVSNLAGTGQYVGWRGGAQTNPVLTFNFTGTPAIDEIDIYIDNSQFGGVFAPSRILIDGVDESFSAAIGDGIKLAFTGLGLTGSSHTIEFVQGGGTWTFVSEITFDSGRSTVPEPGSLALAGLALLSVAAVRRRASVR